MTTFFTWFGLVCASLCVAVLTFYVLLFFLYASVYRGKMVMSFLKRMVSFYTALPKPNHDTRYWAMIYDRGKGEFSHVEPLNSNMQTSEEVKAGRDELRQVVMKAREESRT